MRSLLFTAALFAVSAPAYAQEIAVTPATATTTVQDGQLTPASAPAANTRAMPATAMIDSVGSGAIPALPLEVHDQNGVKYVSGGIGDEEEAQLKSTAGQYNLRLMITASGGEYISGALVRVLDAHGQQVLSADDAGPYFYAQLPPGDYTVEMTATQGGIKTQKVKIPASGAYKQHVAFMESGGITTPHTPQKRID